MCGLFGAISTTLMPEELDRVTQLGIISQLRGVDSTGTVSAIRGKDGRIGFKTIKHLGNASNYFDSVEVYNHFRDHKPFMVAGHCRAATIGNVTGDNAHPYNMGKIIGM